MATIIDGKTVSASVKQRVAEECKSLYETTGKRPGLAVIIVGDDPASRVYVNNKKKACELVGFLSREYALPENTTQETLSDLIEQLNQDDEINGILCQLPLPKHLDEKAVIEKIAVEKDVDAFHCANVGKIMIGDFDFLPCTPSGIMEMLDYYNIPISGKECVVLGRSNIVGKPMAMLLLHKNGTVTICHSRTQNLKEVCQRADILVVAVGKPCFVTADMVKDGAVTICHSRTQNLKEVCQRADILVVAVGKPCFVTADMVKDGAVVIDVGINRKADGKLCGDVDFAQVEPKASYITPVPGGVGPMTIATLMKNTLTAFKIQNHI